MRWMRARCEALFVHLKKLGRRVNSFPHCRTSFFRGQDTKILDDVNIRIHLLWRVHQTTSMPSNRMGLNMLSLSFYFPLLETSTPSSLLPSHEHVRVDRALLHPQSDARTRSPPHQHRHLANLDAQQTVEGHHG